MNNRSLLSVWTGRWEAHEHGACTCWGPVPASQGADGQLVQRGIAFIVKSFPPQQITPLVRAEPRDAVTSRRSCLDTAALGTGSLTGSGELPPAQGASQSAVQRPSALAHLRSLGDLLHILSFGLEDSHVE